MVLYGGCMFINVALISHTSTSENFEPLDRNPVSAPTNSSSAGVFGPAATVWFNFLQRRIVLQNKNLEIVAKVLTDQCVFASTNLFCFLSSMAIMEGSDPKEKLASTYTGALQKNWMLWPLVQGVNFKFVPLEHRVLVVNVVSLGWNCYLSYLNSQGKPQQERNKLEEEEWR